MNTPDMQAFIEKNKTNKIISGERRTAKNKPVINQFDLKHSDRVLYKFDDGIKLILTHNDINSEPGYKPDWGL